MEIRITVDMEDIEKLILDKMKEKFPGYTVKVERLYNVSGDIEARLQEIVEIPKPPTTHADGDGLDATPLVTDRPL